MRTPLAVALGLVLVLLAAGSSAVGQETRDGADAVSEELHKRDELIAAQEHLLNTYRCLFGVDLHIIPGGCSHDFPAPGTIASGAPDCIEAGFREPWRIGCFIDGGSYSDKWIRTWHATSYIRGRWEGSHPRTHTGDVAGSPTVDLGCINDYFQLSAWWGSALIHGPFGSDPEALYHSEISHRFDGGRIYTEPWQVFDRRGAVHPRPHEFLQRMTEADTLELTAWDDSGGYVGTAVFDLGSAGREAERVLSMCDGSTRGW